MRQCNVFIHGTYAGRLTETDDREYLFVYDDDYISNPDNSPVCLAMPTKCKEYHSPVLFPYFFNILSEGTNRMIQSKLLKIDANDDFGILMQTAQHDTPGSVTIKPL